MGRRRCLCHHHHALCLLLGDLGVSFNSRSRRIAFASAAAILCCVSALSLRVDASWLADSAPARDGPYVGAPVGHRRRCVADTVLSTVDDLRPGWARSAWHVPEHASGYVRSLSAYLHTGLLPAGCVCSPSRNSFMTGRRPDTWCGTSKATPHRRLRIPDDVNPNGTATSPRGGQAVPPISRGSQ